MTGRLVAAAALMRPSYRPVAAGAPPEDLLGRQRRRPNRADQISLTECG
jgi:hypothetical protein